MGGCLVCATLRRAQRRFGLCANGPQRLASATSTSNEMEDGKPPLFDLERLAGDKLWEPLQKGNGRFNIYASLCTKDLAHR